MKSKSIQSFNLKGYFKNKGEIVTFSRNIRSISEEDAKEKFVIHLGSKHNIKRQAVHYESAKKVKDDENEVNTVLGSNFKYIRG